MTWLGTCVQYFRTVNSQERDMPIKWHLWLIATLVVYSCFVSSLIYHMAVYFGWPDVFTYQAIGMVCVFSGSFIDRLWKKAIKTFGL